MIKNNINLKQKTTNGVFWSSIERFSAQGINWIFGIIIARQLLPSDYGLVAMLTIFISLSNLFVDGGFTNALIRKIDRTKEDLSTIFYFNIVIALICYTIIFLSAPLIAKLYDIPELAIITRYIAITFVLGSLCVVHKLLFVANLQFKVLAKISLTNSLATGIFGLILAFNNYGVWTIVFQQIFAATFTMLLIWFFSKWKPVLVFSKQSFKELLPYGSRYFGSGFIEVIYNNLYTILIGKFYNSTSLGFYSRAEQLVSFPSTNFTAIIQRVSFPVFSTIQNDEVRLRCNFYRLLRVVSFLVFPSVIALAAVAYPLISLMLTDKWIEAAPILQILCFSYVFYPVHALNVNIIEVSGHYKLFLRPQLIKKIVGSIILIIFLPFGIKELAFSTIISSIFALGVNFYYASKVLRIRALIQIRIILPILLNCIIMFLASNITMYFIDDNIFKIFVGLFTCAIYYILSSFIFKSEALSEVIAIVKRKNNEL